MKVLIIAMTESIHTARWLSQINDQGWNLFLFSSSDSQILHGSIDSNISCNHFWRFHKTHTYNRMYKLYRYLIRRFYPDYLERRLHRYIKRIKPDIIHSMETQKAGYLVSAVKEKYYANRSFPVWWHTNWGSDIYLFGRLKEHVDRIKRVLANCDFYSCECQRDVRLAHEFGFSGRVLPVYPNAGGFNLNELEDLKQKMPPTSKRKVIALKGYQGWAGRALVGLRALARASDILKGYEIVVFANTNALDIRIATELFTYETGISVTLIPKNTSHKDILSLHGKARISMGLSISDSISISLLEAMAMGSFPIQSWTSAADEWINSGENGLLVSPEDPEVIETAIRKALLDDELVDKACEQNWNIVRERLDYEDLKKKTIKSYLTAYDYSQSIGDN